MSLAAPERTKVLWLGAPPRPKHSLEHANRGLALCDVNLDDFDEAALDYAYARGIVFCAMPPKFPAVRRALGGVVRALNHGLCVLILVADSVAHAFVAETIEKLVAKGPARDRIRYRIGAPAHEVAELFARHDPGPAINLALRIDAPAEVQLTDEQRFMLQRAFSDCSAISLLRLPGGRSALTLSVQATLKNSSVGPHPLPFFAKIDRPALIVAEQGCYQRYAESHIAWYLRPNLQPGRCLIGADSGILVGSFVDKSESLWSQIMQGRAEKAIKSLFVETLAGWRHTGASAQTELGSIPPSLEGVFAHANVRRRYVKAAAALGFTRDPQDVWEGFLNLPSRTWAKAPIHGDLHAQNVRVRGQDAIIIDLAKVTLGPPGADPACLEVWIAFEMPCPGHEVDEAVWLRTVQELFAYRQVASPPGVNPSAPLAWLRDGVIHTRAVALGSSTPVEYVITLALYLLRRARFEPDRANAQADELRRTWAWILGCQLLEAVQAIECDYKEAA
jgi:hypothetical protein